MSEDALWLAARHGQTRGGFPKVEGDAMNITDQPELTAEQIIMQALDNFNSDDFCDTNFLPVAAQRIIVDLEFRHFRIIKLEPKVT